MDAEGNLFRLVSEAKRISLAHLFDPFLAVQTSNLDPLPHQIEAVYDKMLPRQPLRFLLADDPGAGKTIMAGLFCKELMIRGDVERCLVVAPGSLVEQWQDELWQKFALPFEILTKDMIEAARSGNPFGERPLLIARLDHLSRNEDLQAKLAATDWDLIVVDEAHKMAAHYVGGEVKETKRYKLGRLAGSLTRHFVLMTATPHAGIEEDFQLFLALLDADRFEGRARSAAHATDTSDLMRRLVKEKLLKFDGTPLFPERCAYTAVYPLSDDETLLYKRVTDYVVQEMNRAERLKAAGEGSRGAIVGFALTTLQRRLASSPEAIYQSLSRRRRRLEKRIAEERIRRRGAELAAAKVRGDFRVLDEDFDLDDLPEGELEELEEELVDEASAAGTIAELEYEIATLADLEDLARQLRDSGGDRKWEELSRLLQRTPEMFDSHGSQRKLIVFSEHRDTVNYLVGKLRALLGAEGAVVSIHGSMSRDERRKIQEAFIQDKDVLVLVATDAAGEGINLQRAHLMVNYDLPWNPNRIEQRFGSVVDGHADQAGNRRVVSSRFEFVSVDPEGTAHAAGWAPYLDLRPAVSEEMAVLAPVIDGGWVRADLEDAAVGHGVGLARAHLEEVRRRIADRVERTAAAVQARLESEIRYWDHHAAQLRERELAGKLPRSGMNSARARQRAEDLQGRLKQRLEDLEAERRLAPLPPVVTGGALIVPAGLLASPPGADERLATERAALDAVMSAERALGRDPVQLPPGHSGYDIESRTADGSLLFIEVKGRASNALS